MQRFQLPRTSTGSSSAELTSLAFTGQRLLVKIVEVSGDVDMSTYQQLAQTLEPSAAAGDVVLDCSQVAFFDSMGLRVTVTIMQKAAQAATTFTLVPSRATRRVLELAGVTQIFSIQDAPPHASPMRALAPSPVPRPIRQSAILPNRWLAGASGALP